MSKLDRYVVRELIVPFLIGTFAVVLMFQANTYIAAGKKLDLENVPFVAILQVIMYQTPAYLNLTLPTGMALAAALAISRLAREAEITAMRAAGARIMRIFMPVVAFGALVGVANFYNAEKLVPPATRESKRIMVPIGMLGARASFRGVTSLTLRDRVVTFQFMERRGVESLDFRNVLMVEYPNSGQVMLTTAEGGSYRQGVWRFRKAYVYLMEGVDMVLAKPGEEIVVNERIVLDEIFAPPEPEELTLQELQAAITDAKKYGRDPKPLEVAFHVRYAIPAACVVFSLVAPIFAVVFARTGGFAGVLVSFLMVLLYYNAFVISTKILSKVEFVPAWAAAWVPNLLFAGLGILAVRRLE